MQEDVLFWMTDKLTIYKLNPRDILSSTSMKRLQEVEIKYQIMS